jgi:signal transduction histidine kinase
VQLRLAARPDGRLTMQVRDNGRGLHRDGRRSPLAFGLKGMAERVMALGGSLRVEGSSGDGTVVIVEVARSMHGASA